MSKANPMLEILKRELRESTEMLLSDVCELCHHPHVMSQQELDEKCSECMVYTDLDALLTRQRTITTGEVMAIVTEEMHPAREVGK